MFLKANGYTLTAPDGKTPLGHWVTLLVDGSFTAEVFTEIIKPFVLPVETVS
jgi:hypothetical protein